MGIFVDNFAGGGPAAVMRVSGRNTRHGYSYSPEYKAWQTMRLRCTVPTNPRYEDYGGRGITVCARWMDSVENFIADMGPKPTPKHELDRIENDKGYEPGNCRWTTRKVNDRNRRSNRHVEYNGERLTIAGWSERTGIPRDTLKKRLDKGWTVEQAITAPLMKRGPWRRRAA